MNQSSLDPKEGKRFGSYLRRLRESRKLSLDAVESMTAELPERVTKSHLSRIENGQAEPSFRRMFALSQIYGMPVTTLAERFELELKREATPVDLGDRNDDEVMEEARRLRVCGRHADALAFYDVLLERHRISSAPSDPENETQLRLQRVNCLVQMAHFNCAKEEIEELLDESVISSRNRMLALHYLAICCHRTHRYTVALLALEQAEQAASDQDDSGQAPADLAMTKGNILVAMGRAAESIGSYELAANEYATLSLHFEHCRARRNLATAYLAAGEVARARSLLVNVLEQAEVQGYDRQVAYALSDLGVAAWTEDDLVAAESFCLRSNKIARPREYISLVFRNSFYLWKIAKRLDDEGALRINERTLRAYAHRVDEAMPEAREYLGYVAGEAS